MGSEFIRVTTERAVAAVVSAKICQRDENFARISDDGGLEASARSLRRSEQDGESLPANAQQMASFFARDRLGPQALNFINDCGLW